MALDGEPPDDERLTRGLDELALAYHLCPETEPGERDGEPCRSDYRQLYQALGARFPNLGLYACADPTEVLHEPLVGDAIDDLADIVLDLQEVLWRFDHLGADDALWHFRFLFRSHWGRHLRELALYLHARMF
jgi:hypothetical protein